MPILDYSKYKRFFAFGCSFTSHQWPTWANVIAQEMPGAIFYNYGITGAGNIYIASKISECNQVYEFCDTDLVMVMWSTFVREDRFLHDRWESHGSVLYNKFYDDNFKKKYFDLKGYVIRDLALIDLTAGYLQSLPCDYFDMLSVQPDMVQDALDNMTDDFKFIREECLPTYKKLLQKYKLTYYDFYPWNEHITMDDGHTDTHPNPYHAFQFLKLQGFNLSENTERYAKEETNFLKSSRRTQTIIARYANLNAGIELKKTFKNKFGH